MLFSIIILNFGTPKLANAELPIAMNWNWVHDTYFQIIAIEIYIKRYKNITPGMIQQFDPVTISIMSFLPPPKISFRTTFPCYLISN